MAPQKQHKAVQVVALTERIEDNVEVSLVDTPEPGPSQVLVRLHLRPINPSDVNSLKERPKGLQRELPFVAGNEGVGIVEALGSDVKGLEVGQRVVALPWSPGGTWQELTLLDAAKAIPVPSGVSDEDAAQFFVNPFTVYGLLETAAPPADSWIIQSAAGSVLGRLLIALAKKRGVRVVNLVRRSAQIQELLDLGADAVVGTDQKDWAEKVKEITGEGGAYAAFDAVGGEFSNSIAQLVRDQGITYLYGSLSGPSVSFVSATLIYRALKIEGWVLPAYLRRSGPAVADHIKAVWGLFLDRTFKPLAGESYPLDRVMDAVAASQRDARGGKVFLKG